MTVTHKNNWHAEPCDDVFQTLDSSENGLTNKQAQERLLEYGENRITHKKGDSVV